MRNKRLRLGPIILIIIISLSAAIGIKYIVDNEIIQKGIIGRKAETVDLENDISVHFIDVGQGDCELIIDKGKTVLIDAGEADKGDAVLKYLNKLNIKEINYMIATHPHSDHVGGLTKQIANFKVDNIIMPNIPQNLVPTTKAYTDFLKAVDDNNINVIESKAGLNFQLGEGILSILGPIKQNYSGLNSFSVPAKFSCRGKSFLLCGDMEKDAEKDTIASKQDIKSDVFKLNHHGSDTSNTREFLDRVDASYYVVEVGKNNKYNLPSQNVLKRLGNKPVYRTDKNSDIVFKIEGDRLEIKPKKE